MANVTLKPPDGTTAAACASPGLAVLAGRIGAACEGPVTAMGDGISAALAGALADPSLLSEAQRCPAASGYARHLLYADPKGRFSVVSLVWQAGQFSPVHGHYTWCAYVVKSGELLDAAYAFDSRTGVARILSTVARRPGEVSFTFAGLDQIHRLGNPGGGPAVSIHVYGLDGARVATHVNRVVRSASQEGTEQ